MAADTEGNDLSAVSVPVSGKVATAAVTKANVIADADMGKTPLALPADYKVLGLIKVDGGPQEGRDSSDPIEFFQEGYKLNGDATVTVQLNLAEDNLNVNRLLIGAEPDPATGVVYVPASAPDNTFLLFTATRYKNRNERRRLGVARISEIEVDQETRGEVRGKAVTFEWMPHDLFRGFPYKEWFGNPNAGNVRGTP